MKKLLLSSIAFGAVLLTASTARPAFNPAIVPADTQWLVFVDLGAVRDTELGKQLIALVPTDDLIEKDSPVRPDIQKILGTVGTLTAFGTNLSEDSSKIDGALVLQGTEELRKIADGLLAAASLQNPDEVKDVTDLPFTAYSIGDQLTVALPPEPIILAGKSREALLKALETFRGKAPSMAKGNNPLLRMLPKNGTFYAGAASMVPNTSELFSGDEPQARVLRMARAASVGIGEDGPMAVGHLQLDASSSDTAVKMERIVLGITAMASLAETDDESLMAFINAVNVTRDGTMVTLRLAYPTDRLLQMIKGIVEEETRGHSWQAGEHREPPAPPPVEGTLVGEWVADQDLGSNRTSAENLVTKSVGEVALEPGMMLVLTGRRDDGENARFDYLELTPVSGGAPIRIEAEYMRLKHYSIESVPEASGGELIVIQDRVGTARTPFQGQAGTYSVTVRYADENDGQSTFAVSVIDPSAAPAVEKPRE